MSQEAQLILQDLQIPAIISKDECIYCFETPFNRRGSHENEKHALNICLTCFQPLCMHHVLLHLKVTGHSCDSIHKTYLRLIKTEKEQEQSDDTDPERKKIKLHVVEKTQDELYDTAWQLVQYNGTDPLTESSSYVILLDSDTSVDSKDKTVYGSALAKVDKILNAKSQAVVDQTTSWELELKPCIHTEQLAAAAATTTTASTTLSKPMNKCNNCELESNLWMCLYCGNVGCGRAQVGIEGHTHALEHFNANPEHAVAIKLGSMSETSQDVYCYVCNEDVKFSDVSTLRLLLRRFGVELDGRSGTEKTLTELQVEQNMKWEFGMTDSSGKQLTSLEPSKLIGCGLVNLGNSCYLNSVIQSLFNGGVPHWNDKLTEVIGTEYPLDVVYPQNNLRCQLIKLNNAIRVYPELYPDGVKPTSFKKCLAGKHEEFSSNRQQDAMEFLNYLLDQLDSKIFSTGAASSSSSSSSSKNPNDDIFKFIMEDKIQCKECNKVQYSYQMNETIQLPISKDRSIVTSLNEYFSGTSLEYRCPQCKKVTNILKRPALKTFPRTLVVNPVRIKFEQGYIPVKTNDELIVPGIDNFEEVLDISQYHSNGYDSKTEELLPEEEDEEKEDGETFKPNEVVLGQLLETGFSENACKRALYETGNTADPEIAMEWLMSHMETDDIDAPFDTRVQAMDATTTTTYIANSKEALDSMLAMGLPAKLCKKALVLNNGDVNRSVDWVFNNLDDDGELPPSQTQKQKQKQKEEQKDDREEYGISEPHPYRLTAVVCHKGNSVQSGHYVAFIRKPVDKREDGTFADRWVLYNDEKIVVADGTEEIKRSGYIYFYSQ